MRFKFDGKEYYIEFRRTFKERVDFDAPPVVVDGEEKPVIVKATYPDTAVTIYELGKDGLKNVFRTAKAGCYHKDKFNLEKGRCSALRLATRTIPKAMKPVLWKAYHERPRTKSEKPVEKTVPHEGEQ